MAETTIEWAKYTFNPWRGCEKIAPGCDNCYAAAEAKRFPANRGTWGPNGTRVVAAEAQWRKPIQWNRAAEAEQIDYSDHAHRVAGDRDIPLGEAPGRPRVFCASLADVFEDWEGPMVDVLRRELWVHDCEPSPEPFRYVPMPLEGPAGLMPHERENYENGMFRRLKMADVRERLFKLIDETPNLDWLLLTKRPENIAKMWPVEFDDKGFTKVKRCRPNAWLGSSVSDQATADKAIPELLKCRDLSPVLFLSAEPLVGPIDFGYGVASADGFVAHEEGPIHVDDGAAAVDWIIFGGESGHGARMCSINWIRKGVEQCRDGGVSPFVKQLGARAVMDDWSVDYGDHLSEYPMKHSKGGDMAEWPADLRVREMPTVRGDA